MHWLLTVNIIMTSYILPCPIIPTGIYINDIIRHAGLIYYSIITFYSLKHEDLLYTVVRFYTVYHNDVYITHSNGLLCCSGQ